MHKNTSTQCYIHNLQWQYTAHGENPRCAIDYIKYNRNIQ